MEKNNFSINLAEMDEVFKNKTLSYRINGFAYACNMENIEIPNSYSMNGDETMSGNVGVLFTTKNTKKHNDSPDYFIAVNKKDNSHVKCVVIRGQYDDLYFTFVNYYKREKLDKKIIDIPFSISLEKRIDKYNYKFDIETQDGERTKFTIIKYREFKNQTLYDDIVFYANVMDFSKILKLVKSFVFNPILVFNTYNEIDQKYKRVYTNGDLDKAIMEDERLDKPMSKIKKMWKRKIG